MERHGKRKSVIILFTALNAYHKTLMYPFTSLYQSGEVSAGIAGIFFGEER